MEIKLISWNVNGFRACMDKGFSDFFGKSGADVVCLQEIKCLPEQIEFTPEGYFRYINSAEKKGYSGTAVFTKFEPVSVKYGIDGAHTDEGRVITLEYKGFYLICCYSPNAQNELVRIDYRMEFEDDLRAYMTRLSKSKPVILCGDLNVAHEEIDLKNPKTNIGNPGFSYEERGKMTELLAAGFTDTFRYLYPEAADAYSWWSYRANARPRNVGWRIDYFIVSSGIKEKIKDAKILADVMGSDHCPVELDIEAEI